MIARINHEHAEREKLEQARQELLKRKQALIAENKKRKDDLANLDQDLERFIDVRLLQKDEHLLLKWDRAKQLLTRLCSIGRETDPEDFRKGILISSVTVIAILEICIRGVKRCKTVVISALLKAFEGQKIPMLFKCKYYRYGMASMELTNGVYSYMRRTVCYDRTEELVNHEKISILIIQLLRTHDRRIFFAFQSAAILFSSFIKLITSGTPIGPSRGRYTATLCSSGK